MVTRVERAEEAPPRTVECCEPTARRVLPQAEASRLASLFKALSDPTRVQVLRMLAEVPELCVCDINANFSLEPSTMSHHLKVLREAGFLASERRGLWVYYRLEPGAEATVRKVLL
ncbi:MAG: helix-turn-helix transcriptional regulator [Chloroflexota bacterium]|nr:helix-turn-helix transcriptional regulator [Chloroflexota bacterium]